MISITATPAVHQTIGQKLWEETVVVFSFEVGFAEGDHIFDHSEDQTSDWIGMDSLVDSLVGHMGSSQSMNADQLFCSAFFRHSSYHLVTDVTVPLVVL